MNYFSNQLLKQYLNTKIPLSVFVSGKYLRIVDIDDIEDPLYGYGMNLDGSMDAFDYRTIKHIKAGDNIIDIQTALGTADKSDNKADKKATPEKEPEK